MKSFIIFTVMLSFSFFAHADDNEAQDAELGATPHSKASQELPKVLYVVPWKEMDNSKAADQKLVLHDFFGDLYDPVLPSAKDAKSVK